MDSSRHPDIQPSHPGEMLAEIELPALGNTRAEFARLLGVSRQTLYDILKQRQAVTPAMVVRLGKLCGNGSGLWLRMQQAHDLRHAERTVDMSGIETLQAAEYGG